MPKKIDTDLYDIHSLFTHSQKSVLGKEGIFMIPPYQRAYNWLSTKQCDKLWNDINTFIEPQKSDSYFLGSIIINSVDEKSDEFHVIDGQQRLTTFMLLLKALLLKINVVWAEINDNDDNRIIKDLLKDRQKEIIKCLYVIDDEVENNIPLMIDGKKSFSDLKTKYKNESINEKYGDQIKKILGADSFEEIEVGDNGFYSNFAFFYNELKEFTQTKLNGLAKAFLNDCEIITITSYQMDEAINIFNSLNSTGMPLTTADILSATLYKNHGNPDELKELWREIIDDTEDLKALKIVTIDEVLNQYMYILKANKNDSGKMPSVRDYFTTDNKIPEKNPEKFVKDIQTIVDFWLNDEVPEELAAIRFLLLKHNVNFKFYYATYFFYYNEVSNEKKQEFIETLLKLFALLAITGMSYSAVQFKSFLFEINRKFIGDKKSTDEIIKRINMHISENFAKNDIKRTLSKSSQDSAIVYLNEYLFAKEKNELFDFSVDNIEVEHILPSSGTHISEVRQDAEMAEKEFNESVNKLGNKILLEKRINASASNRRFKTKKENSVNAKSKNGRGYKDSQFPIAKSLVEYHSDKWTKDDIVIATEKAADRIVKFIFD